jgi:hypothetical protein
MHLGLSFIIFMRLHLASHLGTLDAPREGQDFEAKSEDGVWWTYPKDRRTKQVPRWGDARQASVIYQALT